MARMTVTATAYINTALISASVADTYNTVDCCLGYSTQEPAEHHDEGGCQAKDILKNRQQRLKIPRPCPSIFSTVPGID